MEGLSLLLLSLLRKIIRVASEMRRKNNVGNLLSNELNYIPVKDRVAKSVLGSQRKKQNPIPNRIYPSVFPGFLKALIYAASYQP